MLRSSLGRKAGMPKPACNRTLIAKVARGKTPRASPGKLITRPNLQPPQQQLKNQNQRRKKPTQLALAPSTAAAKPGPQPGPKIAPQAAAAPMNPVNTKPAPTARMRERHWGVLFSFFLFVLAPLGVAAWYLYERAVDQYASTVGFSVRKEEGGSGLELLSGITSLSGSSSTDTDILYEFINSQKLVSDINALIDLEAMWSIPENDPIFSYNSEGTIEDLVIYWERMVNIFYDSSTGLMEVRALAFRSEDATKIAEAIFAESSAVINKLSDIAREDAIRHAQTELQDALDRLKVSRAAVNEFRNRTQIVDPSVDLATQAGLLGTLQAQLAEALIEMDILVETTRTNDPRIEQTARRVRVIEERISQERRKLGIGDGGKGGAVFADLVGEYERLLVDREFAETAYTASLVLFDTARADARRQSRYLAAYVQPTKAERALFPKRLVLLGLIALFLFVIWSISVLIYYSLKDRR